MVEGGCGLLWRPHRAWTVSQSAWANGSSHDELLGLVVNLVAVALVRLGRSRWHGSVRTRRPGPPPQTRDVAKVQLGEVRGNLLDGAPAVPRVAHGLCVERLDDNRHLPEQRPQHKLGCANGALERRNNDELRTQAEVAETTRKP
eukprot:Amastigsp_a343858_5.p5 type:complete len:145 gc:universal Amastigsp_a343858_5:670-236(-)